MKCSGAENLPSREYRKESAQVATLARYELLSSPRSFWKYDCVSRCTKLVATYATASWPKPPQEYTLGSVESSKAGARLNGFMFHRQDRRSVEVWDRRLE